MPSLKVSSILIAKWKVMYMIEEKNMCDEDDSDEILEYTGGSELSDLTSSRHMIIIPVGVLRKCFEKLGMN